MPLSIVVREFICVTVRWLVSVLEAGPTEGHGVSPVLLTVTVVCSDGPATSLFVTLRLIWTFGSQVSATKD
jgi:hypothetical protein